MGLAKIMLIVLIFRFDLFQIENEYGKQSKLLGSAGQSSVSCAAKLVVNIGTVVPWIMCKESDAPDPVVSILPLPIERHLTSHDILFLYCLMPPPHSLNPESAYCMYVLSG